jgi:hypothetical protein
MAYSALLLAYTLFVVGVGFFPESSQVRKPSLNSHRILIFGLINGHHGANERRIEARCLTPGERGGSCADGRELAARLGESRRLRLKVSKPERALELARVLRDVRQADLEGGTVMVDAEEEAVMAVLVRILVSDGIGVYSARRTVPTLEEIFFGLTESKHTEVAR